MKIKQFNINNIVGCVFRTPESQKLLIERDLGDDHLQITTVPEGRLFRVENPETGEMEFPTGRWVESELATGGLIKAIDEKGRICIDSIFAKTYDHQQMLEIDKKLEAKMTLVNSLIAKGFSPGDPNLGAAAREIWDMGMEEKFGKCPSNSTIRRWFRKVSGDLAKVHELFSRSGRTERSSRLHPEVEKIIDDVLERFHTNQGYKKVDVRADVVAEIKLVNAKRKIDGFDPLDYPSKETIRRRVDDSYTRENYAKKFGEHAAKRKFDGGGTSLKANRVLQIGYMDDTVVDLVTCIDGERNMIAGRPYLTILLDLYSRCVLGYAVSFIPPTIRKSAELLTTAAAGQPTQVGRAKYKPEDPAMLARIGLKCVKVANEPKSDIRADRLQRFPALATLSGKFYELHTDNGVNYTDPAFTQTLGDIGTNHVLVPVKSPTYKAVNERFFRSFNTYLISKLPGATMDPSILRKLGIDPRANACITITELHELIREFLFVYHTSYHSGIDAIPLDRWARSVEIHGRQKIENVRALDIAAGVTLYKKRITANGGVRIFGLTWKGKNLPTVISRLAAKEPHRNRLDATASVTTNIKYNPEDLRYAYVLCGSEWIELENTQPEYADGLTLWQHLQIRDWAKKQNREFISEEERLLIRADLNKTLREAFPDLNARERRAAARMLGAKAQISKVEIEFAEAEPRHDGMGPVIENDLAVFERTDLERKLTRPSNRRKLNDKQSQVTPDDLDDFDSLDEEMTPILDVGIFNNPDDPDLDFDDLDDGFGEYR